MEGQGSTEIVEPTIYESFRLFLIALDRAFFRVPWAKLQSFLVEGIEIAATDLEFGQLAGVQHYLFKSPYSLLRPGTKTFISQLARSSSEFQSWDTATITKRTQRFADRCARILNQLGSEKRTQAEGEGE